MSGPDTEFIGKIGLLLGEVRADRTVLERLAIRIQEAVAVAPWEAGSPMLAVVAVTVHHYYAGAESVFERIARTFEGLPGTEERWHRDLLHSMSIEIRGLRPALLGPSVEVHLRELLAFRHFFHHAYSVDFEPDRMLELGRTLLRTHPELSKNLDSFEEFLEAVHRY